ncbi:MAG: threonine/serine exporter [Caulobacteraceae bacterium]|nr:MAG: threonine/serine exporter [Caulobacteraceae bacterium]
MLKGSAQEDATAVWRLDFAAATTGPAGGQPATVLKSVGPLGVNLVRASEVAVLAERVANGDVAADAVEAEVERIKHLPSLYNRWVLVALAGATGACFTQISGGDWGSFGIAFVAAAVGQFVRSLLQTRKVAVAPITLFCGALSAFIASVGLRLGYSQAEAATLIASVIYIVPGLPLINGFVDMISHRHLVVGFERIVNAAFLFLILAIAIAFAHTALAL